MSASVIFQMILFALALATSGDAESKELARKIKQGNHKAFKAFFNAHHASLLRFLLGKGIAEETAKDLIQKAFVYIWENRGQIDPDKSLRAYLFRIGYTRMLNHIRDNAKFDDSDLEANPGTETALNPEDRIQETELRNAIDKAIEAMPEKRGLVFEMCFIQEFTYREAAEALDVSRKTVENHMGLALKDIRSALKEFKPGNHP